MGHANLSDALRVLDHSLPSAYTVITQQENCMKARLIRIGNSRGVRLAKPVIEEAGLTEEVEVRVRSGAVVITPVGRPRAGWAEAARRMRRRDDDKLLDEPTPTRFDDEEWRWK